MTNFETKSKGPVTFVTFDNMTAGDTAWICLMSDNHFDHPNSREDLEKKHLDLAKERGAAILIFGDLFDAMQGRDDPRRLNSLLKEVYKADNYFDVLVDEAEKRYSPYAENLCLIAKGNHEQKVLEKINTDLTQRLVGVLRRINGAKVHAGESGGWVRFIFNIQSTVRRSLDLKYQHSGGGGNAPVTKGMIDTNRQAVWLGRADIVVNGHNHQNYVTAIKREELNQQGNQIFPLMWFIRTASYLDGFNTGQHGYKFESGPLPQGCVWMEFRCHGDSTISVTASSDLG